MLMPTVMFHELLEVESNRISAFVTLRICYYNKCTVAKLVAESKQIDCKKFDKLEVRI